MPRTLLAVVDGAGVGGEGCWAGQKGLECQGSLQCPAWTRPVHQEGPTAGLGPRTLGRDSDQMGTSLQRIFCHHGQVQGRATAALKQQHPATNTWPLSFQKVL